MFFTKTKEKEPLILHPIKVIEPGSAPLFKVDQSLQSLIPPPLILSNAFKISREGLETLKHRERLLKVKGEFNYWFGVSQVKELQKEGFEWFVLLPFLKHFKYHASLGSRYTCVHTFGGPTDVIYTGDIPDFALDEIEKSGKIKLTKHRNIYDREWWEGLDTFSIHSKQPLPVRFRSGDPIVIGWSHWVSIWLEKDGFLSIPHTIPAYEDTMGVVVAAWDKEAELV